MEINTLNNQIRNTVENRCLGRTTATALRAISRAINNPNQTIETVDHYGTRQANHHLRGMIKDMLFVLGLDNITVGTNPNNKDSVTLYFELWKQVPELFVNGSVIDSSTHVQINGELYCKVPTSNGK